MERARGTAVPRSTLNARWSARSTPQAVESNYDSDEHLLMFANHSDNSRDGFIAVVPPHTSFGTPLPKGEGLGGEGLLSLNHVILNRRPPESNRVGLDSQWN